jgi:hypothetical protein
MSNIKENEAEQALTALEAEIEADRVARQHK